MGGEIADRVRAAHARRLREEETAIRETTTGTSNFGSDVDLRAFLESEAAKAKAESTEVTVDPLEVIRN